ncbi:MAG: hypothetical protein WBM02_06635 [bacterium]
MNDGFIDLHRKKWWIGLLFIPLLAGALYVHLPSLWGGFIGDSAVYYAMADSLAHDGDLRYTKADLQRITAEWPEGPQGVLLVANRDDPSIIHYAKPFLYSLIGAPFVRFLQSNGLLLLNALCFISIVLFSLAAFPDQNRTLQFEIILWSLVFWGLSVVPAYVFSLTPDLFNGALLMAGLIPWVRHSNSQKPILSLFLSIFILSLAAIARPPNALFLLLPFWSLAFGQLGDQNTRSLTNKKTGVRHRIFLLIYGLCIIGITWTVFIYLSQVITGQSFAYSGFRKRIVGRFPFETPTITFLNTGDVISTESTQFIFNLDTVIYNIYYFFIGRFAGLIPHFFPAAAALGLALYSLSDDSPSQADPRPGRLPLWIVLIGLFLFHIIYIPANWHGGSCAVGNRYLISWLPGFFLLLKKPPGLKFIMITAFIAALLSGLAAMSPATAFAEYRNWAKRPIMKLFPMEMTLLESWPVDDLGHRRVDFGSFFLYYSDDNFFEKEEKSFWVKGKSRTDFAMRCWAPAKTMTINIRNGAEPAKISVRVGSHRFSKRLGSHETIERCFPPGRPVKTYNFKGGISYCYPVEISVNNGFIPRFVDSESSDHRFLGCFVTLETNP